MPLVLDLSRCSGTLSTLALACVLVLLTICPALADFDSAVAAYEDGRYQEAQTEFEDLAAAGDERAQPYLTRIHKKLGDGPQDRGVASSPIMESFASIFEGSDTNNKGSASGTLVTEAGPSPASRSPVAAPGKSPTDGEPWGSFESKAEPAPLPVSDVAIPKRRSIWSIVFHLPGDATVVGLQYVAQFLSAETLSRELHTLGRQGEKITLSILAGFWWLVIVKVLVGIGLAIGRLMKAAATIEGQKRYG
jgi:hypothetical protein